jgi:hypothetical protein
MMDMMGDSSMMKMNMMCMQMMQGNKMDHQGMKKPNKNGSEHQEHHN